VTDVLRVLKRLGIDDGRVFGSHYTARCPYHEDAHPSWQIRISGERRGLHHCHSCKEGGDLFDLVMQVRGYGMRASAVGWVEEHFGAATEEDLRVPAVQVVAGVARPRAFRMPAGVCMGESWDLWPTVAREYARARGLTGEQGERWGVGYALEGRLHGRLVLPIHNVHGSVVSYVGRAFLDLPKRYLYPRTEEGADKDVMFGERHWPVPTIGRGTVVVTEGAFKSLAVERAIPVVSHAALGGSGVRLMHVTRLGTFKRVVVFTDADAAGEAAGDELVARLTRPGCEVLRARLAPGEDADSVTEEKLQEVLWPILRTMRG
jgi:DNA primase